MAVGIRTAFITTANATFTSNVTLATVGLTSPIAAGQTQHVDCWVPITVGATGGVRAQLVVPAAGTIFELTAELYNTVAPSTTLFEQQTSAAMTSALANAGDHWLHVTATVVNGATAGNVDLQLAQNTSDALTLTVKRGSTMEVIKF